MERFLAGDADTIEDYFAGIALRFSWIAIGSLDDLTRDAERLFGYPSEANGMRQRIGKANDTPRVGDERRHLLFFARLAETRCEVSRDSGGDLAFLGGEALDCGIAFRLSRLGVLAPEPLVSLEDALGFGSARRDFSRVRAPLILRGFDTAVIRVGCR